MEAETPEGLDRNPTTATSNRGLGLGVSLSPKVRRRPDQEASRLRSFIRLYVSPGAQTPFNHYLFFRKVVRSISSTLEWAAPGHWLFTAATPGTPPHPRSLSSLQVVLAYVIAWVVFFDSPQEAAFLKHGVLQRYLAIFASTSNKTELRFRLERGCE
jgi:hypothetical protein